VGKKAERNRLEINREEAFDRRPASSIIEVGSKTDERFDRNEPPLGWFPDYSNTDASGSDENHEIVARSGWRFGGLKFPQ
jgi:hypothetical protein